MELQNYLERVGYKGPVEPSLACLTGIHRGHAFSIPYENLDVQLGRRLDRGRKRIFDKLVMRRRGGWCYEQHELMLWALQAIGFNAMMVTAAVHRREFGEMKTGNHTAILVDLDQIYLCDVGLGDGIRSPIPLAEGLHVQKGLSFRLEPIAGGYWRFHNHEFGYPLDFDFRPEPVDEAVIDAKAGELQTRAESVFIQNLACQIMQEESVTCLTGRVLRQKSAVGTAKKLLAREEFETILLDIFGIKDKDAASLWPRIEARHLALFGETPIDQIRVDGF